MRPPYGRIDIASNAQRIDVDHRISLRIYFRIADNLLRQANIFRNEKNIIDLYVMLLRFSSLVSETIPHHREYAISPQTKKNSLKKQLLITLTELEALKPAVKQKVEELEKKSMYQVIGVNHNVPSNKNNSLLPSLQRPSMKLHSESNNQITKATPNISREVYGGPNALQKVHNIPVEERFRRLSFTTPRPKEETLLRHSILGPNGLSKQWQPPVSDKGVRYPSNIDVTPVEIPRLQQVLGIEAGVATMKDNNTSNSDKSQLQPTITKDENTSNSNQSQFQPTLTKDDNTPNLDKSHLQPKIEPSIDSQKSKDEPPMILFDSPDFPDTVIIKQPSPPPVLAEVQDLISKESVIVPDGPNTTDTPLQDKLIQAESPMELHISTSMMDTFLKLAKSNTSKNLETCGILAGSLKNRKFYITALIIPKQESTSDTCQATNEEEIFEVQDSRSLFPLGWIHTHPTQSCFMSSVDVHTHYSYQVMLPEAVAIVMAPRDHTKKHGIFRLTSPGGMSVIRHCERRGFHSHEQPADGGPIYKQCTDVYMNPSLKFDVIDLR